MALKRLFIVDDKVLNVFYSEVGFLRKYGSQGWCGKTVCSYVDLAVMWSISVFYNLGF